MSSKIQNTLSSLQAKKQLFFALESVFDFLDSSRTHAEENLESYKAKNESEENAGWYDQEISETEQRLAAIDSIVAHLAKLL